MTSPPRRSVLCGMATLSLALLITMTPCTAWLLPSTNHPRPTTKHYAASVPIDTFGDVNSFEEDSLEEEELDYYSNDAAQTIFPYLQDWRLQEGGTLVGIVYNHPTYRDGEAIATSPLEDGDDENNEVVPEGIVTTVTGSQYLLGQEVVVGLTNWKVTAKGGIQGTVTQSHPHLDLAKGQKVTTSFTDHEAVQDAVVTTASGSQYHLLEPLVVPLLEQWKRLEGGSIAGYVYQHQKIPDGELITTTPLVELDESQDNLVLVTTASGSHYRLGEPEPEKQFLEEPEYMEAEEVLQVEQEDGIYYGEEDEEEEEEEDIPSYHLPPAPPKSNPLKQILSTAWKHHQKMVESHSEPKTERDLNMVLTAADTNIEVENVTAWSNQTVWGH